MRRTLLVTALAASLLITSCSGSDETEPRATSTPESTQSTAAPNTVATTTTAPATAEDRAAFCQATTELNTMLVLSAFSDLAGEGSQDLYLLAKLPELSATAEAMAATAPAEYATEAANIAEIYRKTEEVAVAHGFARSDLETLAADIEGEGLSIEELYDQLGITPDDITAIYETAALDLGFEDSPSTLFGASPSDLGCAEPDATVAACDLLGGEDLVPILGEEYAAEAKDIPDFGTECFYTNEARATVHVVLAGPSFYLPAVWNVITPVDDVGDEAFLTPGLSWPFLYTKQGNTVVAVSVSNVDPKQTTDELAELARIALDRAGG